MVNLQERSYRKNGTEYTQFRITIPQKIIDILRWNGNDKIDFGIDNGKLICKNISKSNK